MLRGELGKPISSSEKGCIHGPSRAFVGGEGIRLVSTALAKKAKDWRHVDFDGRPFFVAINACHSDFWNADDRAAERALFGESGEPTVDGRFAGNLENLNGVVLVNNGVLGNEDNALVRVFRNGTKPLPGCLRPLLAGMPMGELLGYPLSHGVRRWRVRPRHVDGHPAARRWTEGALIDGRGPSAGTMRRRIRAIGTWASRA